MVRNWVFLAPVAILFAVGLGVSPSLSQLQVTNQLSLGAVFSIATVLALGTSTLVYLGKVFLDRAIFRKNRMQNAAIWILIILLAQTSLGTLQNQTIAALQNVAAMIILVLGIWLGARHPAAHRSFTLVLIGAGLALVGFLLLELCLGVDLILNQQAGQNLLLSLLASSTVLAGRTVQSHRMTMLVIVTINSILLLGIVLTGARMPIAIAVVIFPLTFIAGKPFKPLYFWRYLIGLGGAASFSAIITFVTPHVLGRFREPLESLGTLPGTEIAVFGPNSNGRLRTWSDLLRSHETAGEFLLGQGTGSAVRGSGMLTNPHSEYVRFFVDFGLLGLLLLLALLLSLILLPSRIYDVHGSHRLAIRGFGVVVACLSLTNSILLYTDFVLVGSVLLGIWLGREAKDSQITVKRERAQN